MVSSTPLRVGVIGCGQVATTRHLPVLRSMSDVEVVALADIDADRLRAAGDQFGVRSRFVDYQAMLDVPAIDVVAICVPPGAHAEIAMVAMAAKKHVFIEKPLALSLDDADRLLALEARSPGRAMVGFNLRWHRLVRRAQALILQGALGPVEAVRSIFTTAGRFGSPVVQGRRRRESGGGALIEAGVHHFDLWRFLTRSEVDEVTSLSRAGPEDDKTVTVTARLANGALVGAIFGEGVVDSNEVDVVGRNGRLHLDCYRFDGLEIWAPAASRGHVRTRLRSAVRALKELPQGIRPSRRGGDFVASYREEWRHFLHCVCADRPVESTLEDGRRALAIALAAAAAADEARTVKISAGPRALPLSPEEA